MSFLRGSLNYVWCTTSVLGKGATGAVFQGVNKHNGEPVAVKTFNQMSHMRPPDVQMREFEVLRKVNHGNIVKLLAIEDDQEGRGKVIVMELCTGGSLYNILDDPENAYGLPAKEFLLVLEHLSEGMKHLRDNNLVHRDLKPGNIMKFISEDGQTIYKLTDFGAARELHDNQQFVSLYGTEEYLHPRMYEKAVLRKPASNPFHANVDLWSIGVTLYHVATGNLPFRPYGGRKNKETMHLITTKKESGVISGTQTTENGPIEWAKSLPQHCQLSEGLKELVTPLLAGLLEESQVKMWSFESFFSAVNNIRSMRVFHVFNIHQTSSIEVFLRSSDNFDTLKMHIQKQTGVPADKQILLLANEHLEGKIAKTTIAQGFPETSSTNPIFLYSEENNNVNPPHDLDLPKFPSFPAGVSVENDASLAKVGCSVGHECRRRIENYTSVDVLMKVSVEQFVAMLKTNLDALQTRTEKIKDLSHVIQEFGEAVNFAARNTDQHGSISQLRHELHKMSVEFSKNADRIGQLFTEYSENESLSAEWKNAIRDKQCPCKTRSGERSKYLVDRLRDSWQHLLRDRATRTLTYNDEQFHALEKIKISETGKRLKALLNEEVRPVVTIIADCLADWYKKAQTIYVQADFLERDITLYEEALDDIRPQIFKIKEQLKNPKHLNGSDNSRETTTMPTDQKIVLLEKLNVLRNTHKEIKDVMNQNKQLLQLIQTMESDGEESSLNNHFSRL